MTDHLPECPATEVSMSGHSTPPPDYELTYTACICDRLRACEARVRDDSEQWGVKAGYAAALDRARDAVADLRTWPTALTPANAPIGVHAVVIKDDALAAIDALRGES